MVDVVVRRVEFEGFYGLLGFSVENFGAAEADAGTSVVQCGFVSLKSLLDCSNDFRSISIAINLKTLYPIECTITPITPLKSKRHKSDDLVLPVQSHHEKSIICIRKDCSRRNFVLRPLVLHSFTVGL